MRYIPKVFASAHNIITKANLLVAINLLTSHRQEVRYLQVPKQCSSDSCRA